MDLGLGPADLLGALVGFVLTLLVFSYIFGDNALFRIAIHIFVGVAAGYTLAIAFYNIIYPQLVIPLFTGSTQERLLMLVPLGLALLLFAKLSTRLSDLGTPVMAFLVGVGAAAAVGGALFGTLLPQALASMNEFDARSIFQGGDALTGLGKLGNASLMLVGTLTTLAYFQFGMRTRHDGKAQRPLWLQVIAWIGTLFIAITFGALFAGVYTAALMALIERLNFLVQFILSLISL
jgi:hypothetical protein